MESIRVCIFTFASIPYILFVSNIYFYNCILKITDYFSYLEDNVIISIILSNEAPVGILKVPT